MIEPRKHRDRTQLAPRKAEMLGLQQQGLTYREIAERLSLSMGTVSQCLWNARKRGKAMKAREVQ